MRKIFVGMMSGAIQSPKISQYFGYSYFAFCRIDRKKIEKFSGHCIFDNYNPYFVWSQKLWVKKIAMSMDGRNRDTIQICCYVIKNLRFNFPQ